MVGQRFVVQDGPLVTQAQEAIDAAHPDVIPAHAGR